MNMHLSKEFIQISIHTEKFSTSIANGVNANRGPNETGQTPIL